METDLPIQGKSIPAVVVLLSARAELSQQIEAGLRGSSDFQFDGSLEDLRHARQQSIDFCLLDLNLVNASAEFRELRAHCPECCCVLLAEDSPEDAVLELLLAGADGCIDVAHEAGRIAEKLRQMQAGGTPLPPKIATGVLLLARESQGIASRGGCEHLSPRERQVIELLTQGALYKEIAHQLGISLDTVRRHIMTSYRKLGVRSRREAARKVRGEP